MKITFDPPQDNRVHMFCIHCNGEAVVHHPNAKPRETYNCSACGHSANRAIIIDPKVSWWLDPQQEYWHETAGVFVRSGDQYLFFDRQKHPAGLTVPAGHRDKDEDPERTGIRELGEETDVKVPRLVSVATEDIWGDECRRGADVHRWYIWTVTVHSRNVKIDRSEGSKPVWLTLEEALRHNLTPAVRRIITRHGHSIHAAVS